MKIRFNKPTKAVVFSLFLTILSASALWAQKFPVSLTDGKNNTVVLKKKPQHIISLGAASTEILYKVGAGSQIVAVSDVCNYPAEANNLPKVGGFGVSSISIETLLSYDPDFVILYSGMQDYLIPSLKKYDIPFYVSDVVSVDELISEIKKLATVTGYEKEGTKLEKEYSDFVKSMAKKISGNARKVYWEVWYEPFMSAGGNSFINDVISLAGGKNIFASESQSYPIVSEETIIASNPDFILIPNDIFVTVDAVKSRRGWNEISAVKNDKVILFDADVYTRPGPRIFEAIKELNSILYE